MPRILLVPSDPAERPRALTVPLTADICDPFWWPIGTNYAGREPLTVMMCGRYDDCNIVFDEESKQRNWWFKPMYTIYGDAIIFMQSPDNEDIEDMDEEVQQEVLLDLCVTKWVNREDSAPCE